MRAIYWNLTDRCNLRCKHCYLRDVLISSSEQAPHELGTEDCLKIVDQFEEAKVFFVTVLGGEPFCRPDIMEILRYLGEKRFWTKITTNCTLIDENTAHDLVDAGIREVFVSLEGPLAEVNDVIRGRGSFEKALKGIRHLQDFGMPFSIQMTISKVNYKKIEDMADFCLRIGAEKIFFESFNDFPSKDHVSSFLNLERDNTYAVAQKIAEIRAEYPDGFISSDFDPVFGFLSPHPDSSVKDRRVVRCGLGLTQVGILSNGDVIPCIYMRDIVLGNLMEIRLSGIPITGEFKKIKTLRTLTVDDIEGECRHCEWKYVCGGGCRGRAYLKYNDLSCPDPYMCLLARR
jgi:radical SAM protein with 4Fe4S-binding SPASM domain